jgi:transcription elongation factor Elf1
MGKRKKAAKKVVKKKRTGVSKTFKCPSCSTDHAVECKM